MIQKRRFTPPARPPNVKEREVAVSPLGGFHGGIAAQDLPGVYSPEQRNIEVREEGFVTQRSGLSRYGAFNFGSVALGAAEVFDAAGNLGAVVSSKASPAYLHPTNQAWSGLSYMPGTVASWSTGDLSGTSQQYFEFETIFSPDLERNITVFSNGTDMVKFFEFGTSAATFSDFTWIDSISSTKAAADIASVNDRLVFFNMTGSAGTNWPTRVMWSARGNPLDYTISGGAGAEDLKDMRGSGQAVVRFRDFLLLFTELEIWRATPTLDDYAFRFDRVVDGVGTPYPRTIAVTPNGVIFLGRDREVYVTDGSTLAALGPVNGDGPSRIQKKLLDEASGLQRAWGLYNQTQHRYELYYPGADSPNGFPSRALFFDFRTKTWWPQRYTHGLSCGVDAVDTAGNITWDDLKDSWNAYTRTWDSFNVVTGNRRVNVFASDASTYRQRSDQTTDDSTAIDVRWRSRGFKTGTRKVHLKDVWIDYETDSSSSASLYVGSSRSGSVFTSERALNLSTANDPLFAPVWTTDQHPAFEIRWNDGGQPRIASFSATIQDGSKF